MFNRLHSRRKNIFLAGCISSLSSYFISQFAALPHYFEYIETHKDNLSLTDCVVNPFNQLESAQHDLFENQARAYAADHSQAVQYILVGFLLGCLIATVVSLKNKAEQTQVEPEEIKATATLSLQERLVATGWKEIPDGLRDPVSFDLLDNPFLIVESGHSFNPSTLEMLPDNRCPITRMPFHKPPIPNHTLRKASEDYVIEKEAWAKEQKTKNHSTTENKNSFFSRLFGTSNNMSSENGTKSMITRRHFSS